MNATKLIAACALFAWAGSSFSQQIANPAIQNVAQLSASASVDVQQDVLTISMTTTRDGADAGAMQTQLKQALETALAQAKSAALPGQLDVRTGNFSLYPRYSRDGKINGWQGSTELVLEGKDFPRISSTAGKITTLSIGNVGFALSREQRGKAEVDAQAVAIDRFKGKSAEIAKNFGFGGYSLREVSINANDQSFPQRQRTMAMEAKSMSADASVPVEAGKTTVVVTVSGSVQMK
jgi:predicted secreted protein